MSMNIKPNTAVGPYVSANGITVIASCEWARALIAGRSTSGKNGCGSGSQCACVCEDEPTPRPPFRVATKAEADAYWDAMAAGVEDSRW